MKNIVLSKFIELNQNNTLLHEQQLYNNLLEELRQNTTGAAQQGNVWKLHQKQNTPMYIQLTNIIQTYASNLLSRNQEFEVSIIGKQQKSIPMHFNHLYIQDFDWAQNASIHLFFHSATFELLDSFGTNLVLLQNENSAPFMVNIEPDELSFQSFQLI